MDLGTTCESDLESIKGSLNSPLKDHKYQHQTIQDMKKAFRKRKKIVENINSQIYSGIKNDVEDDPSHNLIPNVNYNRTTVFDFKTPKRNFFPLSRPIRK